MLYEVKSIPYWAFIKISFFVNLIGGFVIGFLSAPIIGIFLGALTSVFYNLDEMGGESYSVGMMMVVLPFVFGFAGAFFNTVLGLIFVFIYNLITKIVGGFQLNLETVPQSTDSPREEKPAPVRSEYPAPPRFSQKSSPPPPPAYKPEPPESPSPDPKPDEENKTTDDEERNLL